VQAVALLGQAVQLKHYNNNKKNPVNIRISLLNPEF
jgi:hypothetical protein